VEEFWHGMSVEQLQEHLRRMKSELDDLVATFDFNLANTPDHHNEAMLREHEDEIDEYRKMISDIERLIREKKGPES
jgi:ribosomal protein L29